MNLEHFVSHFNLFVNLESRFKSPVKILSLGGPKKKVYFLLLDYFEKRIPYQMSRLSPSKSGKEEIPQEEEMAFDLNEVNALDEAIDKKEQAVMKKADYYLGRLRATMTNSWLLKVGYEKMMWESIFVYIKLKCHSDGKIYENLTYQDKYQVLLLCFPSVFVFTSKFSFLPFRFFKTVKVNRFL